MIWLLGLYCYLKLMSWLWHLKDQKVFEESAAKLMPKRCFLLSVFWFIEKDIFIDAPTTGASAAPMASTRDDHTGDERIIDILLAVSEGLKVYMKGSRI